MQLVGGVRVAWTEKKVNRTGSTIVTCWLVPAKSYEHRAILNVDPVSCTMPCQLPAVRGSRHEQPVAIRLPRLMSDGTSFCSPEGRCACSLLSSLGCCC